MHKGLAGLAVTFVLVVFTVPSPASASALTQAQVSAIISLLQSFGADAATIANVQISLTGGTPSRGGIVGQVASSCAFTHDLALGSSDSQVTCLQRGLIAAGYSIPSGATGYFGAQTQAAVTTWQKAVGISPAYGYFGTLSRAHWNALSTVNTSLSSELAAARARSSDITIQSDLNYIRSEAEIYYSDGNSYTAMCTDSSAIVNALSNIKSLNGVGVVACNASTETYAVASLLVATSNTAWCVDSTGVSRSENAAKEPYTGVTGGANPALASATATACN